MTSKVLFPTIIWTHAFLDLQPMLPDWIQRLNEMRAHEQGGKGRSTRAGWSGPKTLFQDPAFQPLLIKCQQAFKAALREMGVPDGFSFAMEAWGNIHDAAGFNLPHIHREAVLSGCFYLHTPTESGETVFHDPRPGTLYSRPWGRGANSWSKVGVQVKPGMLLLFPNWLEHSVEQSQSVDARYSIAMNAILPRRFAKNAVAE